MSQTVVCDTCCSATPASRRPTAPSRWTSSLTSASGPRPAFELPDRRSGSRAHPTPGCPSDHDAFDLVDRGTRRPTPRADRSCTVLTRCRPSAGRAGSCRVPVARPAGGRRRRGQPPPRLRLRRPRRGVRDRLLRGGADARHGSVVRLGPKPRGKGQLPACCTEIANLDTRLSAPGRRRAHPRPDTPESPNFSRSGCFRGAGRGTAERTDCREVNSVYPALFPFLRMARSTIWTSFRSCSGSANADPFSV